MFFACKCLQEYSFFFCFFVALFAVRRTLTIDWCFVCKRSPVLIFFGKEETFIKKFFSDFKEFAMRGNVLDMAVGVVIGSAFGKIVSSLVADIITPIISLLTGSVSLTGLKVVFRPEEINAAGEVIQNEIALTYGSFIQAVIDFIIIAFSIFVVLRIINKAHEKIEALSKKEELKKADEEEKKDTELSVLLEIKELLEKKESESKDR